MDDQLILHLLQQQRRDLHLAIDFQAAAWEGHRRHCRTMLARVNAEIARRLPTQPTPDPVLDELTARLDASPEVRDRAIVRLATDDAEQMADDFKFSNAYGIALDGQRGLITFTSRELAIEMRDRVEYPDSHEYTAEEILLASGVI